jgi:ketosteroid isomerase-like protein
MAGDPDSWISNWTEDCHQLPPGGPMMIGKQMLYESISAWLKAHSVSEFNIIDLAVHEFGDYAYGHGNYSYRLAPKDGRQPYFYQGKFLSVFQRQSNGEWKLHCDCFNANKLY